MTTVLEEAEGLVNGARRERYGPPEESLSGIAEYWTAYLRGKMTAAAREGLVVSQFSVDAHDVCMLMTLLKIARSHKGYHRDSNVDGAGYLRLDEMIHEGD